MARRKETLSQVDFSLGSVRPEAVERDDVALIDKSVRVARNTIGISTGQMEARPGTGYIGDTLADNAFEVDFGAAGFFELHIVPNGIVLYGADGAAVFSSLASPWVSLPNKFGTFLFPDLKFWVVSDPDSGSVLIGAKQVPIQSISYAAGSWSYGAFSFASGLAGQKLQPYWAYHEGAYLWASARTGAVTVHSDQPIFTPSHVGLSVRYVDREILLTGYTSATQMSGTVIESLPPTYDIVVASSAGYQLGEAVEHEKLGGKGIISGISGTTITVISTSKYDGFNAVSTPKLVAPNAAQVISSVTVVAPAPAFLWDIQMTSAVHGYAGTAARHGGRTYLGAFPNAPLSFAASAAGAVTDFGFGVNDADGFADSLSADRGGSLRYIVSAEDLLFLTSRGLFYQMTRDGSAVTPTTINPVHFASMGCAEIAPAVVEDGCIFADEIGKQIHAAILGGDVSRSWRTFPMAKYHAHLPVNPVRLSATSSGSETSEQFVFAVLADGSAAVCQWDKEESTIAWRPWDTDGAFRAIYQSFGTMRCIADRTIAGVSRRTYEAFISGSVMDCSAWVKRTDAFPQGESGLDMNGWTGRFATHLFGHVATVYMDGWDLGDRQIDAAGKPLDANGSVLVYPDYDGEVQIGLPFDVEIIPWARRSSRTQTGTREVKRIVQIFVTVQATGVFSVGGLNHGGYRLGENLTLPPEFRDMQVKTPILGRVAYETIRIVRHRPGPFRLLKLAYRVVI